jgi:hypothetical protein
VTARMEAKVAQSLLLSPTGSEKIVRGPSGSVRFSRRFREQDRIHLLVSAQCQPKTSLSNRRKTVSCSYKNFPGILQKIQTFICPLMQGFF